MKNTAMVYEFVSESGWHRRILKVLYDIAEFTVTISVSSK